MGYSNEEILSEIIQDARAGINAFGQNVTQYQETVKGTYAQAKENTVGRDANGVRETRGPDKWDKTTENNEDTEHTPEQKRIIKEFYESVDKGAVEFANRIKTLSNKKYRNKVRYSLSDVSERQAKAIQSLTGIDAAEFENIITGGAIDHIENRHGANGKADKSMANSENIGRIGYVLNNFDSAELLLNDDGTPSVSDVWKNSDGKPAKRIVFTKRIDGEFFVAVAAPDSNARIIAIESAFIGKTNGSTGTVLNMDNSPQVTPEAPQRANASAPNVSQEKTESKGNFSRSETTEKEAAEAKVSTEEFAEIKNDVENHKPVNIRKESAFSRAETTDSQTLDAENKIKDTVSVADEQGRASMEWNGHTYEVRLMDGVNGGTEPRFYVDGAFSGGYLFKTKEEALEWGRNALRKEILGTTSESISEEEYQQANETVQTESEYLNELNREADELTKGAPEPATMTDQMLKERAQMFHDGNYGSVDEGFMKKCSDYWEAKKNLERLQNKTVLD